MVSKAHYEVHIWLASSILLGSENVVFVNRVREMKKHLSLSFLFFLISLPLLPKDIFQPQRYDALEERLFKYISHNTNGLSLSFSVALLN